MTKRGMSDADLHELTVRIRTQCIEFFDARASRGELKEAAQRFAEYSGFDIFSQTSGEREGVIYLEVTYTNPEIPWLSPDEPPMVTFRSGEQN